MYPRYILKLLPLAIVFPVLVVSYTNCSEFNPTAETTSSLGSTTTCATAAIQYQNPKTIQGAIDLINALPKPLSLDCFLWNLQRPLDVYAVDNAFSAQPSAGQKSPRILIFKAPLVLSVVPAGTGRLLLELSELVDTTQSVKAEIQFPIYTQIVSADAFDHLVKPPGQTDCRFCHQNEQSAGPSYPANAFKSNIVKPDAFNRVSSTFLRQEAQACDERAEPYRCAMLEAIFVRGQARDTAFP